MMTVPRIAFYIASSAAVTVIVAMDLAGVALLVFLCWPGSRARQVKAETALASADADRTTDADGVAARKAHPRQQLLA